TVNGYKLLGDFRMAGGGQSRWTFASQGSEEFFIKEFLAPTYPIPDSPGSAETKRIKMQHCAAFERYHWNIQTALAPLARPGGNLVVAVNFFRYGTKYYKVT